MSAVDPKIRLRSAGVALGTTTIAWGRRPPQPRSASITGRDRQILTTVYDLGYLTTSMLALLFWGRSTTAASVRLKLLHDVGYLDRFRPRVARTEGSHEWIYRLTQRGWDDIVSHEPLGERCTFRPAKLTSPSYVEHDLQANALVLHLALLAAQARGWAGHGGLLAHVPFNILGPRAGAVHPSTERRAKHPSDASDLAGRLVHLESAIPGPIAPDATLLGIDASGRRTAVMIEYDRTRRAHKQVPRWRRYDHFLTSDWRNTRYATLDLEPLVLFVCADEAQVLHFVRTADQHLGAWLGLGSASRRSGDHVGREQTAFTSRDRLLRSDWRMLQPPPTPPALRDTPGAHRATPVTSTELDIPRLFERRFR